MPTFMTRKCHQHPQLEPEAKHATPVIALLGGAAAATWAPAARAQGDRVRRVAVLALAAPTETVPRGLLREELQKLGWREGRNLRLDVRIADDEAALRVYAEEVVKAAPEVIFALAGPATQVLQARTRTIPIVFVGGPTRSKLDWSVTLPGRKVTPLALPTLSRRSVVNGWNCSERLRLVSPVLRSCSTQTD
jgi:ABC-type uncharacterized transport system substrate-binding protein